MLSTPIVAETPSAIHPRTTRLFSRWLPALCALALAFGSPSALAQSGEPQQQKGAKEGDKEQQKKVDEFAEAARVLSGPAGHPECVWLGRRVVNLLWRDDLDTAFRHLDLYDRFQCPGGHVQATFRCVVRQGSIDPKAPESLAARVHQCWINPSLQPASAGAPPAGQPAQQSTGTNSK
jgi:hypothetical protein